MKNIIYPKCPHCQTEYRPGNKVNNRLDCFTDGHEDEVVQIICPNCGSKFYARMQIKYISTKRTRLPYQEDKSEKKDGGITKC